MKKSLNKNSLTKIPQKKKFGREINPHIFSPEEFKKRVKEKDHFITNILKDSIKEIIGKIDEYR